MFWDELIRRWRRDVGGLSPQLLRAAGGHVAVVPAPRPRGRSRMSWLVLLAAVLAVIALLLQGGPVRALLEAISI
jgi:hypothetical protein